eukprot:gene18873-25431_t
MGVVLNVVLVLMDMLTRMLMVVMMGLAAGDLADMSADGVVVAGDEQEFAHCETLVPVACLLGLFKPGGDNDSVSAGMAVSPSTCSQPSSPEECSAGGQGDMLAQIGEELQVDMTAGVVKALRKSGRGGDPQVCYKGLVLDPKGNPAPGGWVPQVPYRDDRLFRGSRVSPYAANMAVLAIPGIQPAEAGSLDYHLDDFLKVFKDLADASIGQEACKI